MDPNEEEEIFKGIMEIIPPELMNDEKSQIDRKHREQKGSDKENHASRHKLC